MFNVVIEEPYEFVPPSYSEWWPTVVRLYLKRYLRKKYGVHSVECRGVERLQASLDSGHGVLLAPNHCRLSDPLILGELGKQINRNMHAMASWHVFKQDWFTRFVTQKMGAFSVYREGVDRQAINTAVDILVAGKRPLVLFPEGAISRHNDELMPMMDGTAFIARTAAKRREKSGNRGGVVVHPIAIRYYFQGDLEASVLPVIEDIEAHFSWYPQGDRSLVQRLNRIGQALLSLKEIEYFGAARTGDFYERVDAMIEDVLAELEERWQIKEQEEGVVSRVKNLRAAILPDMVKNNVSEEERRSRWKQLAACYYVQQMSHYPRNYVHRSQQNILEHIIETVERFEEDFTDQARVHGPFHVVLQVGEAIEVNSQRDRSAAVDPIMQGIRTQLNTMIVQLAAETTLV